MLISRVKVVTCAVFFLFLGACESVTQYTSLSNTKLASSFSAEDQVSLVRKISYDMQNSPAIRNAIGNNHPTLMVDVIHNKTSEHIDTESLTDTLKVNIINSGMFHIINRNVSLLTREAQLNNAGLTDQNKAIKLGKLYGAQYVLYGNFSSIVNYASNTQNTFYKFTVILQNIETGEEIWVGEATINKVTS